LQPLTNVANKSPHSFLSFDRKLMYEATCWRGATRVWPVEIG
jgi:hypothetical protein